MEESNTYTETFNEWKKNLQQVGYKVNSEARNLGDLDVIIDIYEQHIKHAERFRLLTAKEQKLMIR